MAARRISSSVRVKSRGWCGEPSRRRRSSSGSASSLLAMVDTATVSTITMPVAAESPPMKTNSASAFWPAASGSDSTKCSGLPVPWKYSSPASAMGSTNRLIRNRYSGNIQLARRTWSSCTFSTTITWNWRGNTSTAHSASTISPIQRAQAKAPPCSACSSAVSSGTACARVKMSPRPPYRP